MALLLLYAPFIAVFQFVIAVRPAFLWHHFWRTATHINTLSMLVLATRHAVPPHLSFDVWHLR
ncbi:MAG: hypothetical protein JRJ47_08465 [Deltaproteobacteria bacterium]|nr:hypothetical protein [Deltaproteobacteria bacterium]